MTVSPLLLQAGGSLIAIVLLFLLARAMKLGGAPRLETDADLARIADEVDSGFVPVRHAIAVDGASALAKDSDGRIMAIKRHGNRFAGRILTSRASASEKGDLLVVHTGERNFGAVQMACDDRRIWAEAINQL
ncbi:hypothetical protein [Qipengyuania nanhaisediminis]|uniref:hypothetical protein n=1 Tax=Qipengyuania nanhaisediminis TaxID=604088 RepID=UPI0038B35182